MALTPDRKKTVITESAADLRARLGRNRDTSPLFDPPQFARNLEAAYLEMWRIRASGSPPRAIEL